MSMTLGLYLLRHFLSRVGLCVAGLTAILLVFALLANADEVTQSGHVALPLLYYALLRLPDIFTLILPLAVLMAAMMSLGQLAMRQELISAMAGGVAPGIFGLWLLLAGFGLGGVQFAVANLLIPETSAELRLWADAKYAGLPRDADTRRLPAWFSAGETLIHAGGAAPHGHGLTDVTVIERDENGLLREHFEAKEATYHHDRLELRQVTRKHFDDHGMATLDPGVIESLTLPLVIRPGELAILAETVQELRFKELRKLNRIEDDNSRIDDFYAVSLERRLAQPASVPVMILLALPLSFQLPRRNRLTVAMAAILALGFVYLIVEQMMLALGEGGHVVPVAAAWAPALLTAIGSVGMWFHRQRPAKTGALPPPSARPTVA